MNNDIQNIKDAYAKARHDHSQWTGCFGALADLRTKLNKELDGRCIFHYDPEQVEVLEAAAKALSPIIGRASRNRAEAESEMERMRALLFSEPPSDKEFYEIGERMAADPKAITTNIEGSAYLAHTFRETCDKVKRDGCCGGEPNSEGRCFDYAGICPNHSEATKATAFCEGYLKWLDDVQEQAGLAAVAARLGVSGSVISECSNV